MCGWLLHAFNNISMKAWMIANRGSGYLEAWNPIVQEVAMKENEGDFLFTTNLACEIKKEFCLVKDHKCGEKDLIDLLDLDVHFF